MRKGDENRRNYAFERGFGSDAEEGQSLMPRPKSGRCMTLLTATPLPSLFWRQLVQVNPSHF